MVFSTLTNISGEDPMRYSLLRYGMTRHEGDVDVDQEGCDEKFM